MTFDSQFFLLNHLAGKSAWLDRAIVVCAEYLPYAVVAAAMLWFVYSVDRDRVRTAVGIVASLIVSVGATAMIRFLYHRPRPFIVHHVHQLIQEHSWSFPSQHATFFFALAISIYQLHRRWGIAFLIAATIISLARVAAGVHYPSDILAGAILGSVMAIMINRSAKIKNS